jgi:hypothetical protein
MGLGEQLAASPFFLPSPPYFFFFSSRTENKDLLKKEGFLKKHLPYGGTCHTEVLAPIETQGFIETFRARRKNEDQIPFTDRAVGLNTAVGYFSSPSGGGL